RPPRPLHAFPTRRSSDLRPGYGTGATWDTDRGAMPHALASARALRASDLAWHAPCEPCPSDASDPDAPSEPGRHPLNPDPEAPRSEEHTSELQSREKLVC